jgi:hypothetical protein
VLQSGASVLGLTVWLGVDGERRGPFSLDLLPLGPGQPADGVLLRVHAARG